MKEDERLLLIAMHGRPSATPGSLAEEMGMPENRALAICERWARRGIYETKLSPLSGYLTDHGRDVAVIESDRDLTQRRKKCKRCGTTLPTGRRSFCSNYCAKAYRFENRNWSHRPSKSGQRGYRLN